MWDSGGGGKVPTGKCQKATWTGQTGLTWESGKRVTRCACLCVFACGHVCTLWLCVCINARFTQRVKSLRVLILAPPLLAAQRSGKLLGFPGPEMFSPVRRVFPELAAPGCREGVVCACAVQNRSWPTVSTTCVSCYYVCVLGFCCSPGLRGVRGRGGQE